MRSIYRRDGYAQLKCMRDRRRGSEPTAIQAATKVVSMEEEVRKIFDTTLKNTVSKPEHLGNLAVRLFSLAYNDETLTLPERDIYPLIKFK